MSHLLYVRSHSANKDDTIFGNIGYAFVKTLVMFMGEMDYSDLEFKHWLGYVIFVLFAFLLIIVLMNILNGLAVSDIQKIKEEVDTYYHISIVETLASTSFVSLYAEEVVIHPNTRPEHPKILGIPLPGFKVIQISYVFSYESFTGCFTFIAIMILSFIC